MSAPNHPPILLSAVQPSNRLTLGNYLGAIQSWVQLQRNYRCFFLAVDLHALTTPQDPLQLSQHTLATLATYLGAGIDPQKATLFIQSHVSEHAELAWILNCQSQLGELQRMTQFKSKAQKNHSTFSTGLLTYPLLMAADILLYQTQLVPVGEDQKQHLEIARDLALRMNKRYQTKLFTLPEGYYPPAGSRIMSLQDPEIKMSKSDPHPHATLFLDDSDEVLLKKIKRAVTDSHTEVRPPPLAPGVRNLLEIQAALCQSTLEKQHALHLGKSYGFLKQQTADCILASLGPVREQTQYWLQEEVELKRILSQGAQAAREQAHLTLKRVYHALGLIPPS